jgi:DNA-directed RNA polymerase subunit H (RpoH/RPB5)
MDQQFLYRLGTSIVNLGRLLRDRKIKTDEHPILMKDNAYETAGQLYCIAKAKGCSLGEALRVTLEAPESMQNEYVCIWLLDRNYDTLKQRDRMISTEQIKYLCDVMHTSNHNIVLSPNKLSPQARKEFPKWAELFLFDNLFIDLPRHVLSVKHEVVSLQQAQSVLGETLKASDLPSLLSSDPMVRWHNWSPGLIVFLRNPVMNSFRVVT